MSEEGNQEFISRLKEEAKALFKEENYEGAILKLEEILGFEQDPEIQQMRKDAEARLNKQKTDRSKRNLVYLGMFSVFMLFAGFTSGYIVSMGDNFWIKAPLPQAFWISTAIIVASSITFQLAIIVNKKGNAKALKALVLASFLLGLGFVYFQFKGYGQLMDNGLHFTGSGIIVSDGRYGDYYTVEMDGKEVSVNGNDYYKDNTKLEGAEMKRFQEYMAQFTQLKPTGAIALKEGSEDFTLIYRGEPLVIVEEELLMHDSSSVLPLDRKRLAALSMHVVDGRGDFFVHGEMGKDFKIFFKGEEVDYKDRSLFWQGRPLDARLQIKIQESADTSSSYLYVLTFMHLLHIIVTLLYVIRVVIRSFTGSINSSNAIGLKSGVIFWHFLGLLWVYLLLFLLFIH